MMKKIVKQLTCTELSPSQTIPSSSSAHPNSVDSKVPFAGSAEFSIISGNIKIIILKIFYMFEISKT
jgi:hypothetical protein